MQPTNPMKAVVATTAPTEPCGVFNLSWGDRTPVEGSSQFHRKIGLTSGAITPAVDRVEQRGLVVRTFDATDRRARVVKLTPKGGAFIRKAYDSHVQAMERATSGLSMTERNTLVSLLKKLGLSAERQLDGQ